MRVLVCGGTGDIGSHTAVVLAERGHELVLLDNYSNSSPAVLHRLQAVSGLLSVVYADPSKAQRLLGWRTGLGIEEMCRDAWRWQASLQGGE